jgi:hypothetical protein
MDPVILGSLHQHYGVMEQAHVTDVIAMRVRDGDAADVARRNSYIGKLIGH